MRKTLALMLALPVTIAGASSAIAPAVAQPVSVQHAQYSAGDSRSIGDGATGLLSDSGEDDTRGEDTAPRIDIIGFSDHAVEDMRENDVSPTHVLLALHAEDGYVARWGDEGDAIIRANGLTIRVYNKMITKITPHGGERTRGVNEDAVDNLQRGDERGSDLREKKRELFDKHRSMSSSVREYYEQMKPGNIIGSLVWDTPRQQAKRLREEFTKRYHDRGAEETTRSEDCYDVPKWLDKNSDVGSAGWGKLRDSYGKLLGHSTAYEARFNPTSEDECVHSSDLVEIPGLESLLKIYGFSQ